MARFTRIRCKDHADWLRVRGQGLGGSDAAAIMGDNPFKTNQQLWDEKAGKRDAEDISHKPYVKYGNDAEGSLRRLFRLDFPEYKLRYRNNEILRHKTSPWCQASLDGELVDPVGRKGILEIKTTNFYRRDQVHVWDDKVPDYHYAQLLHYMIVTGYDFAILKVQMKHLYRKESLWLEIRHYHFERSERLLDMQRLLRAETAFWNSLKAEERPALLLPAI